jgi:hypothetical protein
LDNFLTQIFRYNSPSFPSYFQPLQLDWNSLFPNMRFTITSTVALMAGLTATGNAFMIDTFSGNDCNGVVQTGINIWDHTCATWPEGFRSFKVTVWGGSHQYAYFFAPDNCGSLPGAIRTGYVDSTTYDFKSGQCYNFGGSVANAIASYSR